MIRVMKKGIFVGEIVVCKQPTNALAVKGLISTLG